MRRRAASRRRYYVHPAVSGIGEVHVVEAVEELFALIALGLIPGGTERRDGEGRESEKDGHGEHVAWV